LIDVRNGCDFVVQEPLEAYGHSLDAAKDDPLKSHYVYVVDDDRDVRRSLSFMLGAAEIRSHPYGSGIDFLEALPDLEPGCILLDLRMPQMDGFHVMDALAQRNVDWPVIVMTGHGEVPIAVRAMKKGAIDFIEKPFSELALLGCFSQAFDLLEERAAAGKRRREAIERAALLTAREKEVLACLLGGRSNKQIAKSLGISLRTVEMHRGNMMDRLQASSLAEALTLALDAGIEPAPDKAA
jgi:two-component system response regulator FixJ